MSDPLIQSSNHQHSLSDGIVPNSTNVNMYYNHFDSFNPINSQFDCGSNEEPSSESPLIDSNNILTSVEKSSRQSKTPNTITKHHTKSTTLNNEEIIIGIEKDEEELKRINKVKNQRKEKKVIGSKTICEACDDVNTKRKTSKRKKSNDLTRSAIVLTKEEVEKHCNDTKKTSHQDHTSQTSQEKKEHKPKKTHHNEKKTRSEEITIEPKEKETKSTKKKFFSLRFDKKQKIEELPSMDHSLSKEKQVIENSKQTLAKKDIKSINDFNSVDSKMDEPHKPLYKIKENPSIISQRYSSTTYKQRVFTLKEPKRAIKKNIIKEIKEDTKKDDSTDLKKQKKDPPIDLKQHKKESSTDLKKQKKDQRIHVVKSNQHHSHKSNDNENKLDPNIHTDTKGKIIHTTSIKKENEKKTIEVTVEIGYLLQNHIKTTKMVSTATIQHVVEKILLSIKETFDDSIVVYNISGSSLLLNEKIGNYTQTNKIHLYVTKQNKRFVKTITFQLDNVVIEKEMIKNKQNIQQPKIDVQVVYNICRWIYMYGLEIEGLFRISGNREFVKKEVEKCMERSTTFLNVMSHSVNDVHNVVGVLKLYLREKTCGLINIQIADSILSKKHQLNELLLIIKQFDLSEKYIICILLNLIESIIQYKDVNMMGVQNLATIFGPLFVHSSGNVGMTGTHTQLDIAMLLITNSLFIRQELELKSFFGDEEITNKTNQNEFDIKDNFAYDISSLDEENQKLAESIAGWMDRILFNDPEAIHWVKVLYEHDSERFMYVVNMLTPTFVVEVTSSIMNTI